MERQVALAEPIEIGLFTARPGLGAFDRKDVLLLERRLVRGGTSRLVLTSKVKPTFAALIRMTSASTASATIMWRTSRRAQLVHAVTIYAGRGAEA